MRIVSLQPSVTLTLSWLGALDQVCACTKWCLDALPELADRSVTVLPDSWSFSESDREALLATHPDLVIASVPYRPESLTAILKSAVPVLTLAPRSLADIFKDTLILARQVDAVSRAEQLTLELQFAIDRVRMQTAAAPAQTVYCEEWGKPLICSQPWIAELIQACHGRFVGEPGAQTTAETIAAADPEVLLFAWCGAGDRVPLAKVIEQRGWQRLRAVRSGRVFCIPDHFLNTPSFNLHDGLACLAAALHPAKFQAPGLKQLEVSRSGKIAGN